MIALILKRKISAEADISLSVYSRDKGLLELRARGAAKATSKLASHLEPLSLVDIEVLSGKILGARGEDMYAGIKSDYAKLNYAGQVVALFLSKLRVGEKDAALFDFMAAFLDYFNQTTDDVEALFYTWSLKLPYVFGWNFDYGPANALVKKIISSPWSEIYVFPKDKLSSLALKALSLWEY